MVANFMQAKIPHRDFIVMVNTVTFSSYERNMVWNPRWDHVYIKY